MPIGTGASGVVKQEVEEREEEKEDTTIVIVVDPGHGVKGKKKGESMKWMDNGSLKLKDTEGKTFGDNVEYQESDIALDISNKIRTHITSLIPNATAYLTREKEVDLLVDKIANEDDVFAFRWKFAKEKEADILISVHCNSSENTTAKGFEILYNTSTTANTKLAEAIIAAQKTMSIRKISHKQQSLGALRGFSNEAILIEVGFISNADDLFAMTTQSDNIAKEIVNGIKNYIDNDWQKK